MPTSITPQAKRGDRIGTPYQEVTLRYCEADNTYIEHPITLRARACRLEWAPRPEATLPPIEDLFLALFGAAA
jgi:hypothetical protein